MGTNSNKAVVADFNTDPKSQCLHRFQARFGCVEAFRYQSMPAPTLLIYRLAYVQYDISCFCALCDPACKLQTTCSSHIRKTNIQQKYSYDSGKC